MVAQRRQTGGRSPIVYWRAVRPDNSPFLKPVQLKPLHANATAVASSVTLDKILGPELARIEAGPAIADFDTRSTPEYGIVARQLGPTTNAPESQKQHAGWAAVRAPDQLVVSENDFKIPELRVKNLSNHSVLLPAGTAFLGGAQNRMLLEPEIVAPGAEQKIGVYCIEAGRWEETRPAFRSVGRVPLLFLLRMLEANAGAFAPGALQSYAWETILAGLDLTGENDNATMDLMAFARHVERGHIQPKSGDDVWGLFHSDPTGGLAGCALYPNGSFASDALFALRADLYWRAQLSAHSRGAREYFRIFDDSKQLAIRCLADGSPLRDLRRKPILFRYGDDELQNGFRPPVERPPAPERLSFSSEPMIPDWASMTQHLSECPVEIRRVAGPARSAGRPEIHTLRFSHPTRSLIGTGVLVGGRPAYLEATAFRPFAN